MAPPQQRIEGKVEFTSPYPADHQRHLRGLTLKEVAEKLGASHYNAYASYEQGKREPSLGKFAELLAAVAPELTFTIGPRKPPRPAPARATRPARTGRAPRTRTTPRR